MSEDCTDYINYLTNKEARKEYCKYMLLFAEKRGEMHPHDEMVRLPAFQNIFQKDWDGEMVRKYHQWYYRGELDKLQ